MFVHTLANLITQGAALRVGVKLLICSARFEGSTVTYTAVTAINYIRSY